MKFAREKRLLVGWLALLLPLPLPLNQVLEWPALFVYSGFVVYFLQRTEDGRPIVLSNTALNVLGFLYLPILAIDLQRSLLRDQVVRALLHLLLFLLVVKLYSMKQESEKWHVLSAIFFLFVAAMATSSHMTVVFYLVAATALCLYGLARLAHLSMLSAAGRATLHDRAARDAERDRSKEPRATPLPRISWAGWVSLLLIVALAIPVFAAMPRLRKPWVLGRGAGQIGLARTTGFSDQVNLSSLTSGIRENREVVLRIQIEEGVWPDAGDLRLKGASFETYDGETNRWSRPYQDFRSIDADDGRVRLAPDEYEFEEKGRWRFSLEPLDSPSLILPMEAVAVEVEGDVRGLGWGPGGDFAHRQLAQRGDAAEYVVVVGEEVLIVTHDGTDGLGAEAATPRVRELAGEVMGEGGAGERARRLERWLINELEYTTDFVGREGDRPIEEFLFEHRSGHCELFATSMVLMLRSEGIPARLATGFLGAEVNNLEDQLVVRANNGHAWVEALTEGGWQVFDPTPPAGRPSAPDRGMLLLAQQIYDFVVFRFDRYVLTYGSDDQESFFESVKAQIADFWHRFWPDEPDENLAPDAPVDTVVAGEPVKGFALWTSQKVRLGGLVIFILTLAAIWFWRRRPLRAEEAYERLRSALEELGFGVDEFTAPLELRRRLAADVPAAAEPGGRLVDVYLDASWGEKELDKEVRVQLRGLLGSTLDAAGLVAKERRRAARRRSSGKES